MHEVSSPLALARRTVGVANLTDSDRHLLTDEVLERWTTDLSPQDVTPDLLIDIAGYERRRREALRTLRSTAGLTDIEFRLVRFLQRREGRTCSYLQIAHHLWGTTAQPVTAAMLRARHGYASPMVAQIQTLVWSIRHKLEIDPLRPQHFANIRGVGYRYYSLPPSLDDGEDYGRRNHESLVQRAYMVQVLGIDADGGEPDLPLPAGWEPGTPMLGPQHAYRHERRDQQRVERETIEGRVLERED